MEEEVFNDNQSFRFRDKFREGSVPSGKLMEVVEWQPWLTTQEFPACFVVGAMRLADALQLEHA